MARPDFVRVELTALGPHGTAPFKLVVQHAAGTIVEYFGDVTLALLRQGALEELLTLHTGSRVGRNGDAQRAVPATNQRGAV
jgi:hypothetical protein